MLTLLGLKQPITQRKVLEFAVTGFVSEWFRKRNWAAVTIPFWRIAIILYWLAPGEAPDPYMRVHEFQHVYQCEGKSWLRCAWEYFKESRKSGYSNNKFELEAYQTEENAFQMGLPAWAKE